MPDRSSLTRQALTYTFLGFLGAFLIGLLLYRADLFQPTGPGFRFLSFGLAGALCYSTIVFRPLKSGRWEALGILVLVALADINLTGLRTVSQLVSRGLSFLAIGAAAWLYAAVYCRRLNFVPLGRTLIMAGLTGATFLAAAVIAGLIFPVLSFDSVLFWEVSQGFLIGLGLGAGLELAHWRLSRR